jgi:hypothetical protein
MLIASRLPGRGPSPELAATAQRRVLGEKLAVGPDDNTCASIERSERVASDKPNWRHDPFVEATYPREKLERSAVQLARSAYRICSYGTHVWKMRQISLRLGGKSYR